MEKHKNLPKDDLEMMLISTEAVEAMMIAQQKVLDKHGITNNKEVFATQMAILATEIATYARCHATVGNSQKLCKIITTNMGPASLKMLGALILSEKIDTNPKNS